MAFSKSPLATRNPISMLIRLFTRDLVGAYRPERHYMRGPGPKWHEKHAPEAQPDPHPQVTHLRSTKVAI